MTREQWQAIRDNDKSYDGIFYYALKTTKTVCRPSCTARACNPRNVIIYDTLEEALRDGYRPCFRCRPDRMNWGGAKQELAEEAKRLIEENYMEKFSLKGIAGELCVNENYLARVFKEVTGYTLLWYHNHVRCQEAERLLTRPELSITFISGETGYSTVSHFTRVFKKMEQCTPSEYRRRYLESLEA